MHGTLRLLAKAASSQSLAFGLLVIVTAFEVFAQSASTGALTGTVTDRTGAVVPKATITLRNNGTGQLLIAVTDLEGLYRFSLLPPGQYELRVEMAGFAPHILRVVLLDLSLPDLSGLDVITAIRSEFPEARVVVLTTFEGDMDVQRALKAGARGYLLKSMPPQQMLHMIRQVHAGKKCFPAEIAARLAEHLGDETLSRREVEVLQQVAAGQRNRDIAAKLFIAEETVKSHVKHIMDKLRATDRTQSVAIAARRGIIQL